VYFLVLGGSCSLEEAEGYRVVAHLARDDDPSDELLVLVDAAHPDADTAQAAQVLVTAVTQGSVDDHTWHTLTPADTPAE
jgi:hypothetical protein